MLCVQPNLQELQGPLPSSPRPACIQLQSLPSGFVPGAPPCCCSTPAAMELGQNLWVGRCCDLIFLALGAGSGLLASSMGCRMRLRALMNLLRNKMGTVSHHQEEGRVRVCAHTCVCVCARVCTESAELLPDSRQLVLVWNRLGAGLGYESTAVKSPGY